MKIFPKSCGDCSLLFGFQIIAVVSIYSHLFFSALKFLLLIFFNLLSLKSNLFNFSNIFFINLYLFLSYLIELMNSIQNQFNQNYFYGLYLLTFKYLSWNLDRLYYYFIAVSLSKMSMKLVFIASFIQIFLIYTLDRKLPAIFVKSSTIILFEQINYFLVVFQVQIRKINLNLNFE